MSDAMHRTVSSVLVAVALLTACSGGVRPDAGVDRPAGLSAEPSQLAFTCVTPGCDTSLVVRLIVNGPRRVAVKRLLVSGDSAGDFSFTSTERPPFILGAGASVDITVRYAPSGAPGPGSVALLATYTDASADEEPDRLPPGEVSVALVRRLVGAPELNVSPRAVSFGVVAVGQTKSVAVQLTNRGFGNVALEVTGADAGVSGVTAMLPAQRTMTPDASIDLPVSWAPTNSGYLSTVVDLTLSPAGWTRGSFSVEGTSLPSAALAVTPAGDVDFGEVAKGRTRSLSLLLQNQGGTALVIRDVYASDAGNNLSLRRGDGGLWPFDGGQGLTLAPLERAGVSLELNGLTPAEVDARLTWATNTSASTSFTVRGTVTEPKLTPSPATVAFGTVPQGWVLTRVLELRNTGFGTLTVKNLSFVTGSSALLSLVDKPALPALLKRDQRLAVTVQFRAETTASVSGSVSIETDEPGMPFREVPVTALVGTCAAGCPITNGTPSCTGGTCSVGTCNAGYFDTDGSAATGCECHDVDTDPGAICTGANDLGSLRDNDHVQRSYTGMLPTAGDEDLIRFFADDGSHIITENFHVRVRLQSSDPTIGLCVYRHDTGSHDTDCFFDNETCPQDNSYERRGTFFSDDSADLIVKVRRQASAPPTCTSYTVFVSNGL